MDVTVSLEEKVYTPRWRGNQKKLEPIKVTLRYLNNGQRIALLPWRTDTDGNTRLEIDYAALLPSAIVKIEGLWQVRDGERKPIETGRDLLLAYGMDALVMEIGNEIASMNPVHEEIEKNS